MSFTWNHGRMKIFEVQPFMLLRNLKMLLDLGSCLLQWTAKWISEKVLCRHKGLMSNNQLYSTVDTPSFWALEEFLRVPCFGFYTRYHQFVFVAKQSDLVWLMTTKHVAIRSAKLWCIIINDSCAGTGVDRDVWETSCSGRNAADSEFFQ